MATNQLAQLASSLTGVLNSITGSTIAEDEAHAFKHQAHLLQILNSSAIVKVILLFCLILSHLLVLQTYCLLNTSQYTQLWHRLGLEWGCWPLRLGHGIWSTEYIMACSPDHQNALVKLAGPVPQWVWSQPCVEGAFGRVKVRRVVLVHTFAFTLQSSIGSPSVIRTLMQSL